MCCAPGGKELAAARCLAICSRARSRCSSPCIFGRDLALVAALGAFLGHLFPVWLGFKGGKGVATYIGIVLALDWQAAIAFCMAWLVVAALARYSSLAGLIASAATPVVFWFLRSPEEAALIALLTLLLWLRHRENIARLLKGTEGKIGASAKA